MIILVLNFLHHSYAVLESDLVCDPHFCGGSIAHAVMVENINLLLIQRIFKGDTELVELIRELGGVDFTLSVIIHRINHLYLSFRFYCCKTNRPNITQIIVDTVLLTDRLWQYTFHARPAIHESRVP